MRSLLREQLRLAIWSLTALVLTLGWLPLAFALLPELAEVSVGPVPLAWLVLGVLVYPWLVVLGWIYVHRAEANERDFADLIGANLLDNPRDEPAEDQE